MKSKLLIIDPLVITKKKSGKKRAKLKPRTTSKMKVGR